MPDTQVAFFRDAAGNVPMQAWLDELEREAPKAFEKLVARMLLLSQRGYELRRPHCDLLRDGIYELRERVVKVQYRILYFFHGQNVAVLSHGLTKRAVCPIKRFSKPSNIGR